MLRLPWSLSTGADFQFASTEGRRPTSRSPWLQKYIGALMACAQVTPSVMQQIAPVFHLCAGPERFTSPAVVVRVLAHVLQRRLGKSDGFLTQPDTIAA